MVKKLQLWMSQRWSPLEVAKVFNSFNCWIVPNSSKGSRKTFINSALVHLDVHTSFFFQSLPTDCKMFCTISVTLPLFTSHLSVWSKKITSRWRVKSEKIVAHDSPAARLLWVPSLSAVGLLCPLLVQTLHSHVDFHSEGWPWPILCQLEPIAHTASFTFFLCSRTEWQTLRPLGSPPLPWFGFKAQCVWLANWKSRSFFEDLGHSKSPQYPNMWSVWLLKSAASGLSLADFALLIEWMDKYKDSF